MFVVHVFKIPVKYLQRAMKEDRKSVTGLLPAGLFPALFSPLGLFPAGLFPARSFPR